jgi:hypothetical protein
MKMERVTTEQAFKESIADSTMTMAVFKTTWCKDCHFIEPFMPDVERAYAGRIRFIEIDRDELPDLCLELGIMGIPSFIAYREGQDSSGSSASCAKRVKKSSSFWTARSKWRPLCRTSEKRSFSRSKGGEALLFLEITKPAAFNRL